MLVGSVTTKCLEKQVPTVLCHLFHQSHAFNSKSSLIKQRSPLLTFKNHFTYILNSILEKQMFHNPDLELKNYLKNYSYGNTAAVRTLMQMLHIDRCNAKAIVSNNFELKHIPVKTIISNCKMLSAAGLSTELIKNNPELLVVDENILRKKIECVQKIVYNINYGLRLLFHDVDSLTDFMKSKQIKNMDNVIDQIKYFEQEWHIKDQELYDIISKYLYHLTYHPKNTVKVIKLLLDNNVSVKKLMMLNWKILSEYDVIKKRVNKCSRIGILSIEPWILKCSNDEFDRKMKTIDNHETKSYKKSCIIEYLSEMSGYDEILIKYRISNIKLEQLDVDSIKQISDIILKEGYEWHDIIWSINVITLPKNVIIDRFSQLRNVNCTAPFLNILFLSNENFNKYVHNCSCNNK